MGFILVSWLDSCRWILGGFISLYEFTLDMFSRLTFYFDSHISNIIVLLMYLYSVIACKEGGVE